MLNPDQQLTRAEAIWFDTINNARLHFEEREKGSIERGKLPNLILVDRDQLTCPEDDTSRLDDGGRETVNGSCGGSGGAIVAISAEQSKRPVIQGFASYQAEPPQTRSTRCPT